MDTPLNQQNNTLILDIDGMTCAACAARIERVLQKTDKIENVTVSFPLKTAQINLKNNEDLEFEEIIKKINSIGYKAKISSNLDKESTTKFLVFKPVMSLLLTFIMRYLIGTNAEVLAYFIGFSIVLYLGKDFHISAFKKIRYFDFNMDTLVSIGSLSALIISLFPNNIMFLDTGAFIISFILIGKSVEEKVIEDAVQSSKNLKNKLPASIIVLRNKESLEVPTSETKEGDIFEVLAGEIIPLDGILVEGTASVDESLITGESIPVTRSVGEKLLGGSINLNSVIKIKVDNPYSESAYNIIEQLINEAQLTKPKIQKTLDKITQFFVPFVLILSLLTLLFRFIISDFGIIESIENAISVLVIACPCALGLATPIVLYRTAAESKKKGFIFKDFDALQKLTKINTIIFDKTGTLSSGIFLIENILPKNSELSPDEVLQYVASLEKNSQHPIARSLVYAAELKNLSFFETKNVIEHPGVGIEGMVGNNKVSVSKNINSERNALKVTIDDYNFDIFLKEETSISTQFINEIINLKKVIILSGDKKINVESFAKELNIDEFYYEKSPSEKFEFIKNKQISSPVVFIGDGINDSPSLKQADIGVSTTTSSQIAQVSGDILIHNGGLDTLSSVFKISNSSNKKINQNLFLAFIYNISMIPIAVAGLISPSLAALAMALSSISVVLNSSRKLQ
ncbi:MAG: heavy metal translocating P-type ATPase [Candidatus Actinomarina sp.]|nr:cation-translocating P-type ATPase [Actinomycetota bacterium]